MPSRDFPLAPTPNPNQPEKNKKLPSGATSASAEKDYQEAERLRNSTGKLTLKERFEMAKSGKSSSDILQKSDSLRKEGDRKTTATGGVRKDYRL